MGLAGLLFCTPHLSIVQRLRNDVLTYSGKVSRVEESSLLINRDASRPLSLISRGRDLDDNNCMTNPYEMYPPKWKRKMREEALRKASNKRNLTRRSVFRAAMVLGAITLLGDTIYVIIQVTTN